MKGEREKERRRGMEGVMERERRRGRRREERNEERHELVWLCLTRPAQHVECRSQHTPHTAVTPLPPHGLECVCVHVCQAWNFVILGARPFGLPVHIFFKGTKAT